MYDCPSRERRSGLLRTILPSHIVLGEALIANGQSDSGIRELEMARTLPPENVRTNWDLVRAYTAAGWSDDAKREKERIERLDQQEAKQP